MTHTLATLIRHVEHNNLCNQPCQLYGAVDAPIHDIVYDTRRIGEHTENVAESTTLFFALPGLDTDGAAFISDAIRQGARAIVTEVPYQNMRDVAGSDELVGVCVVPPDSIRAFMADMSAVFYGFPAKELMLCGVTGTDGKSTTVEFIHQLLRERNVRAGLWSTVHCFDGFEYKSNTYRQSTPESPDLHKAMREMIRNGCTHAVLEVTSHALSNKTMRVRGIAFDCVTLTTLDSEHLDFHGTVEQYARDKSNLFAQAKPGAVALIHEGESYTELFENAARRAGAVVKKYGVTTHESVHEVAHADYEITCAHEEVGAIHGLIQHKGEALVNVTIPCAGLYNADNALAAIACAHEIGAGSIVDIANCAHVLRPPEGRMHTVSRGGITVVVDYAHTPGSFEKLLPMMRAMVKGNLIVVFGSAGERDVVKRARQGAIADKYADVIIITDEDPRGEDPMVIANDIASGCKRAQGDGLHIVLDRERAIQRACKIAVKGDCVVCLGKGHEKTIAYKDHELSWNEIEVVTQVLNNQPFKHGKSV